MLKMIRRMLGIHEHDWQFCVNRLATEGPVRVDICKVCYRLRYTPWSER